jgi:hypothetical protein
MSFAGPGVPSCPAGRRSALTNQGCFVLPVASTTDRRFIYSYPTGVESVVPLTGGAELCNCEAARH